MLQTLLLFTSICLILLILLRIPEKDGSYLNSSIFTNNRKTSKFLNNLIWILTFIFFLLNIIRVFQTLAH
jgi:protein translocase SecG subunit